MRVRFAVFAVMFVLIAAAPAYACKVCDGNGCKDAGRTETGRAECKATATSCTIYGSTCAGGGCDCGGVGCPPCDISCKERLPASDDWELVSVRVIPAPTERPADWILVNVQTSVAAAVR